MNIIITINTDNAAFRDPMETEVVRILERTVRRIHNEGFLTNILNGGHADLYDINGNVVGKVTTGE